MKSSTLMIGIIAGLAGGALLGILFAPEKGYETRRKLGEQADDLAEGIRENLNSYLKDISGSLKKSTEKITDWSEDPDEQSSTWKEEISPLS